MGLESRRVLHPRGGEVIEHDNTHHHSLALPLFLTGLYNDVYYSPAPGLSLLNQSPQLFGAGCLRPFDDDGHGLALLLVSHKDERWNDERIRA